MNPDLGIPIPYAQYLDYVNTLTDKYKKVPNDQYWECPTCEHWHFDHYTPSLPEPVLNNAGRPIKTKTDIWAEIDKASVPMFTVRPGQVVDFVELPRKKWWQLP